jgi:hypothetical protein
MAKGKKKKDEGLMELLVASVHFRAILSAYQKREDRVAVVEAELSRLFSEYKDKKWLEEAKDIPAGKEGW